MEESGIVFTKFLEDGSTTKNVYIQSLCYTNIQTTDLSPEAFKNSEYILSIALPGKKKKKSQKYERIICRQTEDE